MLPTELGLARQSGGNSVRIIAINGFLIRLKKMWLGFSGEREREREVEIKVLETSGRKMLGTT